MNKILHPGDPAILGYLNAIMEALYGHPIALSQ